MKLFLLVFRIVYFYLHTINLIPSIITISVWEKKIFRHSIFIICALLPTWCRYKGVFKLCQNNFHLFFFSISYVINATEFIDIVFFSKNC